MSKLSVVSWYSLAGKLLSGPGKIVRKNSSWIIRVNFIIYFGSIFILSWNYIKCDEFLKTFFSRRKHNFDHFYSGCVFRGLDQKVEQAAISQLDLLCFQRVLAVFTIISNSFTPRLVYLHNFKTITVYTCVLVNPRKRQIEKISPKNVQNWHLILFIYLTKKAS